MPVLTNFAQHSIVKFPTKISVGETVRALDEPEKSMLPQLCAPATDEVLVAVEESVLVDDAAGGRKSSMMVGQTYHDCRRTPLDSSEQVRT